MYVMYRCEKNSNQLIDQHLLNDRAWKLAVVNIVVQMYAPCQAFNQQLSVSRSSSGRLCVSVNLAW